LGFDPDLPVPGRVCWNEVLTSDEAAAQTFYSGMFGWTAESKDVGPMVTYHVQKLGDKEAGGMMKNPMNGAPDAWMCYFFVEDLKQATDRAKQLGAKAMLEHQPIPDIGTFSMLSDPTGACFSLFQVAPGLGQ
jgi:predicted enzyme related to lactoylglutathione lyase